MLYRPHSIFLPNEPIFLYLEDGRVRKAGFLMVGPPIPVRRDNERFFRGGAGRALRAGIPTTQATLFATAREAKKKRVKAAGTSIVV